MTRDEILYGRLKIWQPDEGPRVNMDTILLASYVRLRSRAKYSRFVELGTATGAVSLMLALRFSQRIKVLGLEIQPELEELAQRNRLENQLSENVTFRCMDLRNHRLLEAGCFDGLVVNPPYEEEGRGRCSPLRTVSIARQSTCCTLNDVTEAAAYLLKNKGRFYAVFRTDRMAEFLSSMIEKGLEPKRLRLVHPRLGRRSNLFLIEGIKGAGTGLIVEPPLFVYGAGNNYTPELLKAYELEGLPCL